MCINNNVCCNIPLIISSHIYHLTNLQPKLAPSATNRICTHIYNHNPQQMRPARTDRKREMKKIQPVNLQYENPCVYTSPVHKIIWNAFVLELTMAILFPEAKCVESNDTIYNTNY